MITATRRQAVIANRRTKMSFLSFGAGRTPPKGNFYIDLNEFDVVGRDGRG